MTLQSTQPGHLLVELEPLTKIGSMHKSPRVGRRHEREVSEGSCIVAALLGVTASNAVRLR